MAERSVNLEEGTKVAGQGQFEAIAPLVQLFDLPQSRRFPHLLPDGTRVWNMSEAITWCAGNSERSTRTIRRRIEKFRKAGKGALEHAARRDKGLSRFFSRNNKAAILAAYLYLALRPSIRVVHRAILRNSELLEVPETTLPSCETVRVWLRCPASPLVTLALEGQRAYRELMFSDLERGLLVAGKDRSK